MLFSAFYLNIVLFFQLFTPFSCTIEHDHDGIAFPLDRTLLVLHGRKGHYMGWVRQEEDDWLVFDDADVSPCKTEDIMNLKGGGDWHMAYLLFYRFKE